MMNLAKVTSAGLMVFGVIAFTGCAGTTSTTSRPTESGTSSFANQLPDGVPLIDEAQLAAEPRTTSDGAVTGWSAVALLPPSVTQASATNAVATALRQSGWTVATRSVQGTQLVTARRSAGVNSAWLNVTVTAQVPSGGHALSYRYVSGPQPVVPS